MYVCPYVMGVVLAQDVREYEWIILISIPTNTNLPVSQPLKWTYFGISLFLKDIISMQRVSRFDDSNKLKNSFKHKLLKTKVTVVRLTELVSCKSSL
jgi:hypothetical protein